MKLLVFVLALANLLFFAYAEGYFGQPDNPDAIRLQKQIRPENIRVAGRGEPPAAETSAKNGAAKAAEPAKGAEPAKAADPAKPAPTPETPKEAVAPHPAETCVAWSGLATRDADRLSALLAEKFDDFKQARRITPAGTPGWWVFIPPQPNKAEADKKAAELKKLGISDFFVVQETGPNHWAISLGIFSLESGAKDRLNALKEKGVRSARMGPRNNQETQHALEARGPASRQPALQAAVAEVLSGIQGKACP
ncbi:MAG: SPOR domain-containing protein [Betaproteobacteria bacterium]